MCDISPPPPHLVIAAVLVGTSALVDPDTRLSAQHHAWPARATLVLCTWAFLGRLGIGARGDTWTRFGVKLEVVWTF